MRRIGDSTDKLQVSLALYRKLLSLIREPRSEKEIIQFVVNALWEQFPDYRVSYTTLKSDGAFNVICTRAPASMPDFSGYSGSWAGAPEYFAELRKLQVIAIADVTKEPKLAPFLEGFVNRAKSRSRLDCTLAGGDDDMSSLAISHAEPQEWNSHHIELIRELAELVQLMLREARAREELRRSEEMFRQFAENINSVFWMTNASKDEMIYISPGYEQLWGRKCVELYETPLSFLDGIHPEDRDRVVKAVRRQALGPYEELYRVIRPCGEIRWVKDRSFPIKNSSGEVYRLVGIAEDITALKDARYQLEQTQAQVVAKAKFAALGEMASGMAHEINNPLAVIHGLSRQLKEICEQQGGQSVVHESLETIEKMCDRITALVKGMRTFSRQTDHDPMVEADLTDIVRETVALCSPRFRNQSVEVELDFQRPRINVHCRPSELSQVLLNMLNNAFDAIADSEKKWIRLAVKTGNEKVTIFIEDGGPGIAEDVREKIFQPFFTTKEVGRGTGLGLSISRSIVEAHGGTMFLDLDSRTTCFVIELPLGAK